MDTPMKMFIPRYKSILSTITLAVVALEKCAYKLGLMLKIQSH